DFNLVGCFPLAAPDRSIETAPGILKLILGTRELLRRYSVDPRVAGWLRGHLEETRYDLIVGRYYLSLVRSGAFGRRPIVLDLDDRDDECHQSRIKAWRPGAMEAARPWIAARFLKRHMQRRLPRCEHIWVAKHADDAGPGNLSTSVLPNIPFTSGKTPIFESIREKSRTMLFIGRLDFPVNIRAIDHFLKEIWPRILAERPRAGLRLVGMAGEEEKLGEWAAFPNVRVVGFVEDPREEYMKCAFSITPIKEGGGTKIKILESLALGRTCVIFRHSLRGYETTLKHGKSLLVADTDEAFAVQCVTLLDHPAKRRRLAESGFAAVAANYTREVFEERVQTAIHEVLRRTPGGVR
ncbi:MAG: glycosyltransferase, partial [Desulfobacterales bacterium]|nr:glycosyltransferase [Desulfobacterales bacterium]